MIDILWVQSRLRDLGFDPGPLDGVRGPRTDAAIVAMFVLTSAKNIQHWFTQ